MKREFLKAIEGLTDEQIDSIMAEHGKDIEAWKTSNATLQKQLLDTQNALKAFEGVNVDELKGQISTLTQQMQAKADEYAKELADRDGVDARQHDADELALLHLEALGEEVRLVARLFDDGADALGLFLADVAAVEVAGDGALRDAGHLGNLLDGDFLLVHGCLLLNLLLATNGINTTPQSQYFFPRISPRSDWIPERVFVCAALNWQPPSRGRGTAKRWKE